MDDMRSSTGISITNVASFEGVIDRANTLIVLLAGEDGVEGSVSAYFRSAGCLKEIRRARQTQTPIIFVLELDPSHSGARPPTTMSASDGISPRLYA